MRLLVLARQEDNRIVGIVGLKPDQALERSSLPVMELQDAAVVGDARLQLVGRRLRLDPVDQANRGCGRCIRRRGRRAPPIEFLQDRERDDNGVVRP